MKADGLSWDCDYGRMSDELELKTIEGVSNNNNVTSDVRIEVSSGNGARSDNVNPANEVSPLLSTPQVGDANNISVDNADVSNESVNSSKPRWRNELQRVKRELNEVVVWKLKVWMVILIILLLIALIFAVTFIVCAAGHVDEDETYDRSSFVVERFFRGNFTLANNSFTSHPETQPDEKEKLLEQLKYQLTTVYNSSSALARYFSSVTINSFSDDTAQFELQFIIPSENEQLVRYILSREMVKNVLFQHFNDQDPEAGNSIYVKPMSLSMEVWTRRT